MTENHPSCDDRPHAQHSPSALAAKEICPGFKSDSTRSKASDEGTRCHLALETGDDTGLDPEQLQIVEMCREYLEQLEDEVRGEGERKLEILREERLVICGGLTFGTLDYLLINLRLGTADLVDFKFGRNPVPDAEVNPQIQAYALGVFEAHPGIESIRVHILLPRRDEVSTAHYTRADESRLRLRIETIIARCSVPEPALNPTDGCLWCARKGECAALHNHALKIASGYSDELVLPDEVHPSRISDPATMSRALIVSRVLEKWCESVRHHALQMRLSGVEIPGHELRARSGTRRITDPLAAWAVVRDRVAPDQFIACCDVSLPKLEETVAESAPRGGKTKAKQSLCESLIAVGAYEAGGETNYLARTRK